MKRNSIRYNFGSFVVVVLKVMRKMALGHFSLVGCIFTFHGVISIQYELLMEKGNMHRFTATIELTVCKCSAELQTMYRTNDTPLYIISFETLRNKIAPNITWYIKSIYF